MGHSQAEKVQSRERILAAAAAQVREEGLESVSVAKLMRKANLTHGGFYGHFASRSDLIAQALKRALVDGEAVARASADPERPRSFASMVKSYLSRTHRDSPKLGCAIAALASDVGRADDQSRAVMESHIEAFISKVADALGGAGDSEAIAAVSTMIGALAISRIITDRGRSDAILRAAREHLIKQESLVGGV